MDKWNLVEAGSGRTESSLDDIWRGRQTQQLADAHAGGERRQESGPVYDSPGRPDAAVRARLVGGIDVLAEAVRWPDVAFRVVAWPPSPSMPIGASDAIWSGQLPVLLGGGRRVAGGEPLLGFLLLSSEFRGDVPTPPPPPPRPTMTARVLLRLAWSTSTLTWAVCFSRSSFSISRLAFVVSAVTSTSASALRSSRSISSRHRFAAALTSLSAASSAFFRPSLIFEVSGRISTKHRGD